MAQPVTAADPRFSDPPPPQIVPALEEKEERHGELFSVGQAIRLSPEDIAKARIQSMRLDA